MAEQTGECVSCGKTKSIKVMRFNKNAAGVWEYLCNVCRALIKSGELKR